MELLGYLFFSRFSLLSIAPLSLLWFRQRIHPVFDQVSYPGVCKSSGDVKAVLF